MENEKTALITGAGTQVGQAIAARLAQDGFALILCDEHETTLSNGTECKSYAVRQSDETSVKELFAKLELEYAYIDVLINAQINNPVESFAETQAEDIRAAFGAGLIPAMLFTQCSAEWMIKRGVKGRIVNISTDRARFRPTAEASLSPLPHGRCAARPAQWQSTWRRRTSRSTHAA